LSRSDVQFAALLLNGDGEALFDQKLLDDANCTLTVPELREVAAAWNVSAALNAIGPLLAPQLRFEPEGDIAALFLDFVYELGFFTLQFLPTLAISCVLSKLLAMSVAIIL
jgi:hypothetical protein